MIGQDLRGVVEAGDGVAALQPVEEVPTQRRQRGRSAGGDARGFVLVIGEPVQDQVLLGREVPEERRLGDLGGGGHLRDGHGVEPFSRKSPIAMSETAWYIRCFLRSRSPISPMPRAYARPTLP